VKRFHLTVILVLMAAFAAAAFSRPRTVPERSRGTASILAMVAGIRAEDRAVQGPGDVQLPHQRHRREADRRPRPQAGGRLRADELTEWGMANSYLEPFQFGRGWDLEKFSLELTAPRYFPMFGYPQAWTPSTKGVLSGAPIYVADKTEAEITALGEKLRGAIVLASPPQTVFQLSDRLQPADTDQLVRIGGPEPPTERQATSVVPANAMSPLLQKLGAGAILRPGTELHGDADGRRQPADARRRRADGHRDGGALQHDRPDDAGRRRTAAAAGAPHVLPDERSQQLQRDRGDSRRGPGASGGAIVGAHLDSLPAGAGAPTTPTASSPSSRRCAS
jgi:hypothetical protein